jgi:hypothetical protein
MSNSNYKKSNNEGTGELVIANDELKPPGPVAGWVGESDGRGPNGTPSRWRV